jgi:hypothetical protein
MVWLQAVADRHTNLPNWPTPATLSMVFVAADPIIPHLYFYIPGYGSAYLFFLLSVQRLRRDERYWKLDIGNY